MTLNDLNSALDYLKATFVDDDKEILADKINKIVSSDIVQDTPLQSKDFMEDIILCESTNAKQRSDDKSTEKSNSSKKVKNSPSAKPNEFSFNESNLNNKDDLQINLNKSNYAGKSKGSSVNENDQTVNKQHVKKMVYDDVIDLDSDKDVSKVNNEEKKSRSPSTSK